MLNLSNLKSVLSIVLLAFVLSPLLVFVSSSPYPTGDLPQTGPKCAAGSNNYFGGYKTCSSTFTFNITSPANLVGSVGFTPSAGGLNLKGTTDFVGRLMIPNLNESNHGNPQNLYNAFACPPFDYTTWLDGTSYAGNILLMRRGLCPNLVGDPYDQLFSQLNLGMILIVDGHTPYDVDGEPGIFNGNFPGSSTLPYMGISSSDADPIISYIMANPNTPIMATFSSSGHILPSLKQPLLDLYAAFTFPPYTVLTPTLNPNIKWFTSLTDPNFDPCYDNLFGLWCENGVPTSILFGGFSAIGSYTAGLPDGPFTTLATNGLKQLSILTPQLWGGAFPPSICNNPGAVTLDWVISIVTPFTSFPDCLDQLSLRILDMPANAFTSLPTSFARSPNLVYFRMLNSPLTGSSLPSDWSLAKQLNYFDVSNSRGQGGLVGAVPNFSGLNLTYISLSGHRLTSMSPSSFDNMPLLETVKVNNNLISATALPSFNNSQAFLVTLDFSSNFIQGSIPTSWTPTLMAQLTTLNLHNNLLGSGPNNHNWSPLYFLTLTSLDLSYNQITCSPGSNYILFIASITSPTVQHLYLQHNQLTSVDPGIIFSTPAPGIVASLLSFDVSYNNVTGFPIDLFSAAILQSAIFNYNPIVGSLPSGTPKTTQSYFGFLGLPGLTNPSKALPSYLKVDTTNQILTQNSLYLCSNIISNVIGNPGLVVALDPSYYGYSSCSCLSGYYGGPPLCYPIPSTNSLLTVSPVLNPITQQPLSITGIPSKPYSFSDQWYGNNRALSGLDTTWVLDLSTLAVQPSSLSTNYSNIVYTPLVGGAAPLGYDMIRSIHLDLFFDTSLFNVLTDEIDIFLGSGIGITLPLVASFRGSDGTLTSITKSQVSQEFDPDTAAIVNTFGSVGYASVDVVSHTAQVEFRSRATSGRHFQIAYAGSSYCPTGYEIDPNTDVCTLTLNEFHTSEGLRTALYIVSAVLGAVQILTAGYLFMKRHTAIVRAASTKFTAVSLIGLVWLSGSASLYAIVPSNGSSSLCFARLWCSCLSLMMVLGVLVAKSFRVSVIFGSKLLMQIKQVTDGYVAAIVGALLLVEIIMLIVFQALNMTKAELVSNGNNSIVWACSTMNSFAPWMGVNIGIFAVVMVAGAVVAFKTRGVPSAFNESTHILFSLQILLFMLIILAPLDWALVNNSPDASVVIQSGGQLLLSLFIFMSNFIPKLYYLFVGRGDDKSMIFNTTGASVSGSKSGASRHNSSHSSTGNRNTSANNGASGGNSSSNHGEEETELANTDKNSV